MKSNIKIQYYFYLILFTLTVLISIFFIHPFKEEDSIKNKSDSTFFEKIKNQIDTYKNNKWDKSQYYMMRERINDYYKADFLSKNQSRFLYDYLFIINLDLLYDTCFQYCSLAINVQNIDELKNELKAVKPEAEGRLVQNYINCLDTLKIIFYYNEQISHYCKSSRFQFSLTNFYIKTMHKFEKNNILNRNITIRKIILNDRLLLTLHENLDKRYNSDSVNCINLDFSPYKFNWFYQSRIPYIIERCKSQSSKKH
jgi:hypothetical protein